MPEFDCVEGAGYVMYTEIYLFFNSICWYITAIT